MPAVTATIEDNELFGELGISAPTTKRTAWETRLLNQAEARRAGIQAAADKANEAEIKAAEKEARRHAARGRGTRGGKSGFIAAAKGRGRLEVRTAIIKHAGRTGRVTSNDVVGLFQDQVTGWWLEGVSERVFSAQFRVLETAGWLDKIGTVKSINKINRNLSHDVGVYRLTAAGRELARDLSSAREEAAQAISDADFIYNPEEA